MCPRNTAADSKSAPQPVAYPPPQAFNPPPQAFNPPPPPLPPTAPGIFVVAPPTPSQLPGQWTTGLCNCCDDLSSCCITFFCPCVTFGQNAEIVDRGNTSCFCAGTICVLLWYIFGIFCCYTCTYRSKLRGLFSLPGDQCGDWCIHCWCIYCALCQEYRELKNRGLDPSMGWVANQQRMQQPIPVVVPPPVQMGMMR